MRITAVLLLLALVSCRAVPEDRDRFRQAQDLVEEIVGEHSNLVRLTIHAVPTGESTSRIIACNVIEKRGQISDPEDLAAMTTGKTVVLPEGDNLDVTAPIFDSAGRAIAATGITLAGSDGSDDQALRAQAAEIARRLSTSIAGSAAPLW